MKTRTLYKLTDENMRTHGGCQWALGVTKETDGKGDLCGPGWLHAYSDPLLAVLLNPIHAGFVHPRLFRAAGAGKYKDDHGLKCGVTKLRLVEELPLPVVTTAQRAAFAILCAKAVCKNAAWSTWADAWLSGEDRSGEAAWAAEAVMWAVGAADVVRAKAAWAASTAANGAARAAAMWAAEAMWAATGVAAIWAARAAAGAAAAKPANLRRLAKAAMKYA